MNRQKNDLRRIASTLNTILKNIEIKQNIIKLSIIEAENEYKKVCENEKTNSFKYIHFQNTYLNFQSKINSKIMNLKVEQRNLVNEYLDTDRRSKFIHEKIAKLESIEVRQSFENSLHEQLNMRMGQHNPAWNRPSKL